MFHNEIYFCYLVVYSALLNTLPH